MTFFDTGTSKAVFDKLFSGYRVYKALDRMANLINRL